MGLCLVVPNSTLPRFVNSELVYQLSTFNLEYLFAYSVSTIRPAVLNEGDIGGGGGGGTQY